ncbi:MAG: hypothetical protein DRP13_00480 [Candidatus Aenigmatarchaeota archaeon]|nr:MAG: hypothetical protein DRP13_00480 [Candidatus Aenigmarchaeota archaeon]
MPKKSQTMIFEHFLLFTISIAIFITSFAVFNSYQSYFSSVAFNDQLNGIKDYISSNLLKISLIPENTTMILQIPKRAGNEFYVINLTNTGLNITAEPSNRFVFSELFYLNASFNFSGFIEPGRESIIISKKGNNIFVS